MPTPWGSADFWPLAALRHRPGSYGYRTGTTTCRLPKSAGMRSREWISVSFNGLVRAGGLRSDPRGPEEMRNCLAYT